MSMMIGVDELWRDIPGYGDLYQVSNIGRVRAKDRIVEKWHKSGKLIKQVYGARILNPSPNKKGYLRVHLGVGGIKFDVSIHRLVLISFVGEPKDGQECCHCNGVSTDNRIENLRWDSHYNNNQDRKKHGTYQVGADHAMAKFSPGLVASIKRGDVSRSDAIRKHGVSSSQYHRIKTNIAWVGL